MVSTKYQLRLCLVAAIIGCSLNMSCNLAASDRVEQARKNQSSWIEGIFEEAGVPYPPAGLYLRAYKALDVVELHAAREAEGEYILIHRFPVLGRSGVLGPKRREGDRQVPEGLYFIDRFNPRSRYHLSLGINYPNQSDRILGHQEHPGSDIFIHGGSATIGCLPLGDPGIEKLYLICLDYHRSSKHPIPVHIFPAPMDSAHWQDLLQPHARNHPTSSELIPFWRSLTPLWKFFETNRRLPEWQTTQSGAYQLAE